jgi:hypothetical protein
VLLAMHRSRLETAIDFLYLGAEEDLVPAGGSFEFQVTPAGRGKLQTTCGGRLGATGCRTGFMP